MYVFLSSRDIKLNSTGVVKVLELSSCIQYQNFQLQKLDKKVVADCTNFVQALWFISHCYSN